MMKPILFNTDMVRAILEGRKTVTRRVVKPQPNMFTLIGGIKSPYRPGDILYVRETWQHGFGGTYLYKASAGFDLFMNADGKLMSDIPWHPSIHMPREAARIFLRVTDVRVERLREITEEQARAEGAEPLMMTADVDKPDSEKRWQEVLPAFPRFPEVWDSTIKPADRDLYGWDANPWCWIIEFERCGKPEGD